MLKNLQHLATGRNFTRDLPDLFVEKLGPEGLELKVNILERFFVE